MPGSLWWWLMWKERNLRAICLPLRPPPTKLLLGSWSWEFILYAFFYQIRREPKISQVKFTFRSWWSYWLSVDINYTGITIDEASFSLCCTVFILAAGFLNVIFLQVKFSSPGIFNDMKLVRTHLNIPLYSCIIQFPDSIRKIDKEKKQYIINNKINIWDYSVQYLCKTERI